MGLGRETRALAAVPARLHWQGPVSDVSLDERSVGRPIAVRPATTSESPKETDA
jgi:hypothetical protein